MTRNRNNAPKKAVVVNLPNSNKSKKQKLKEKRMIKRNAGNQDLKDNKVVQVIKNVNESDSNKSDSMKKPISDKPKNSTIKQENKKRPNIHKYDILRNEDKIGKVGKNENNGKVKSLVKGLKNEDNTQKNKKKNKENMKENLAKKAKKNPEGVENPSVFSKQKNIHKMKKEVNLVACPKDIQIQMSNRLFDRDDCTLFVRFGRETGTQDRQTLKNTFAEKVKEIRDHKRYKNLNYVEFESREQLEEMKSQIEEMKTAGDKPFVDYTGDKGKKVLEGEELKINPLKLFISGLPKGTTPLQIKPLFEKCSKVTIPKTKYAKETTYGFVFFNDESEAKAGFESAQNLKIAGSDILVVYSKVRTHETVSDKRPLSQDNEKENQVHESPSKKQKTDKAEEIETSSQIKTKANNEQEAINENEDSDEEDDDDEESEDEDENDAKNDDDDNDDDEDDEDEDGDDADEDDDDDDEEGDDADDSDDDE